MQRVSKSSGEHDHNARRLWMRKLQRKHTKKGGLCVRRHHLCGTRPDPSMSPHIAACPSPIASHGLTLMLVRETIRPPRTFFVNPTRPIQRTWGRWRLKESPFMRWRFQPVWPSLPTLKNLDRNFFHERASPVFLLRNDTFQNRARLKH